MPIGIAVNTNIQYHILPTDRTEVANHSRLSRFAAMCYSTMVDLQGTTNDAA